MPLYEKYVGRNRDDFATLEDLQKNYKVTVGDDFNYSYDVVDVIAQETPDKLAMLWVSNDGEEKRFTFDDLRRLSNKAANFFKSQGINKGDAVMLVLRRNYQFWYTMLALHRIGAIAIPATHLLTAKDYIYRADAATVKMMVVTADGDATDHVNEAMPQCKTVQAYAVDKHKNAGPNWLDYDALVEQQSDEFPRPTGEDATHSAEPMLMFFTSGTTGYPKMVWHDHTYPLGHILTGCFWHRVVDGGLHFTISDTGWGKALWGKIYGQWLGGSAVLTYDFDKVHAPDILSKMEKYGVTTFCAPPTMYRYFIKEDLTKYDLHKLTHCTTAGEALNPEVYNQWLKQTGLKIFEGFGQT